MLADPWDASCDKGGWEVADPAAGAGDEQAAAAGSAEIVSDVNPGTEAGTDTDTDMNAYAALTCFVPELAMDAPANPSVTARTAHAGTGLARYTNSTLGPMSNRPGEGSLDFCMVDAWEDGMLDWLQQDTAGMAA